MQRIFFSFLTIRLSISLEINVNNAKNIFFIPHYQTFNLTRNKCKQCKEYFFHSSLSDFLTKSECRILIFIPHYQTFNLTRNKCKQCKEYFFHSSLSDFQDSLEINVNNAKNIFFIPHYQTFKTH